MTPPASHRTTVSGEPGNRPAPAHPGEPVRIAYLVSHPIQYQVPLLRRIAQEPGLDLTVLYGSDFSVRGYRDEGFGVDVKWDVPLLGGYRHRFLPALRDTGTEGIFTPISSALTRHLLGPDGLPAFDVLWVHGYATVNQMHGILAARALGIPVLTRSDSALGDRPRSGLKLLAKRLFFRVLRQLVDGILVTGTLNREYWRHYMGPDFPLFLLPYAVDNDWFQQQALAARDSRPQLQQELNLDPARPVILFASKMQPRKHADDLIAAFVALNVEPRPYLLLVGDGEERAALEQQAQATGLAASIRFCGFRNQSELPRFFELATVFVLPARHEPWGLIVNEAMNAARPVIVTTDAGCHPDLITNGEEGFVYPVRDVAALTACLHQVLAVPGTAARMGQKALARIQTWSFEQDIAGLREAIAHVSRRLSGPDPEGQQ